MARLEKIFEPIQVGSMTVPNRIVETTYSINSGRADGLPDAPFIEHHVQRARGGAGWIGNETWVLPTPLPPGRGDEILPGTGAVRFATYEHPDFVPRVRKFTDAVHECGSVCVMQLTHLQSLMCPSAVSLPLSSDYIPHVLEDEEIEAMLDAYGRAGTAFAAAGADAVEVHCAHEALPEWFLSPLTNRRDDRWGGSRENRIRFVVEAVRRTRAAAPESLNVGLRVNADQCRDGGYDLDEMCAMAAAICASVRVDYLNVDVGSTWGMPSYIQPMHYGTAPYAAHAAAIKRSVPDVPVLYAGRVNDPVVAESLVADGVVDLVGMTRAMIADPEMPRKAREGRLNEIRKCIGCNTCIGRVVHGEVKTPLCAVNPVVGFEAQWADLEKADVAKRVVVIGAGPAGLEAARIAALRGHSVTVLEREQELGGMTRLAARAPRREAFLYYAEYAAGELARLGVDVRCGVEADPAAVLALEPDVVIAATGATPRRTDAAVGSRVFDFGQVLRGGAELGKRTVVVSEDDHMITPSVADFIASQGVEVEIFHKWLSIGDQIERYTRGIVFHRLAQSGVKIHPSTLFSGFEGDVVRGTNAHTGQSMEVRGVDSVVLSLGMQSDDSLARDLKGRVPELYNVGSSFAPRFMAEATQHGANVGRLV